MKIQENAPTFADCLAYRENVNRLDMILDALPAGVTISNIGETAADFVSCRPIFAPPGKRIGKPKTAGVRGSQQ